MQEATDWDLWKAGLIGGPEPRGRRRRPAELAAMRAEHDRNFAGACLNLNRRLEAQHGPSKAPYRPASHYRAEQLFCERLGIGSD